jgi:hypothetical protein
MNKNEGISAQESVLVEYSGGLDSTLTAMLMAKKFKRVLLVTYEASWTIGNHNSKKNVSQLMDLNPDCKIEHRIINLTELRNNLWEGFPGISRDYGKFCHGGPPGIICLGCKSSMLLMSIKICLDENIGFITNGLTGTQSDHPEHMPPIINRFSQFMEQYNITYVNEIYDIKSRAEEEEMLKQHGITVGTTIGASNVTHQPRCFLGVYSTLWKASRPLSQKNMVEYFDFKVPLMHQLLSQYSKTAKPDAQSTKIDETKEYKYGYEFGKNADRFISYMLSPVWWLSRSIFWITRKLN